MPKHITITVHNCARCGKEHIIKFYPLTNPIEFKEFTSAGLRDTVISHYGNCPNLNEPILMHFKDKN